MSIDKVENKINKVWPASGFLDGRLALVTGGARRMGRHMARALAEQGADIVLHYLGAPKWCCCNPIWKIHSWPKT